MKETEYVHAGQADRDDLIDFANMVFSQAKFPHDFKKLLPKGYDDSVRGMEDWHYLAKQDGHIRALVACKPMGLKVLDQTLSCGMVGTVSVHLYSRGEGHMRHLMHMMIDENREKGTDMLILGGQRQRYNYYGFEQAGIAIGYDVTPTNVRHLLAHVDADGIRFEELTAEDREGLAFAQALSQRQKMVGVRPIDEFLMIMHSWNCGCRLIYKDGERIGYIMGEGTELRLTDDRLLPAVIKALLTRNGAPDRISLNVAPHERERVAQLSPLAESRSIHGVESIMILNWRKVLQALFDLKADYTRLEDGHAAVRIENVTLSLTVTDGIPHIDETDEKPMAVWDTLEAERRLFGLENLTVNDALLRNWSPLPFFMTGADSF